ncbi:MAG: hypothetical protein ABI569_16160 [Casimicrobiaceae bacterium]
MRANRTIALVVTVALVVGGCATASKDIAATYVSPNQYSTYDCEQLAAEAGRIQTRVVQLGGRLDQAAQNDAGIMVVGVVLFWPVLFALGGTKQQEAEYARLKGEYEAVEQAAIARKCAYAMKAPPGQTASAPGATIASPAMAPAPQPVLAVRVAAETPNATPVVARPNVLPPSVAQAPSKFQFNAERLAKDTGCGMAIATLNTRTTTVETFNIACDSGDPRLIRCDDSGCREMK